jgi:hypothetical protein
LNYEKLFHAYTLASVTAFLIAISSIAHAETTSGTITDSYKQVITQQPYTVDVCKKVAVSGDKTKDTIIGAIIGGAIGNNVTKNVDKVEQRQFAKPKHVIMKLVKKFTVIVQSSLELMDISTDLDLANRKIKI